MFEIRRLPLTIVIMLVSFLILVIVLTVLMKIMQRQFITENKWLKSFEKNTFAYSIAFICLIWVPVIFIFSPGSLINDATYQILQWTGTYDMTSHHPPFSTLILGVCFSVGSKLGSQNLGLLFYTLLQSGCMAIAFALIVQVCVKNWNVIFGICVLLYFSIFPVWVSFAQAILKDGLYVAAVVVFMLSLLKILQKDAPGYKDWIQIIVSGVLMGLLRNNGVYILLAVLISGVFIKRIKKRNFLMVSMAAGIALMWIYSNCLLPWLGVQPGSKAEMLSIPFQQTALYVKNHGDEVTEEEKAVIESVLDYDKLADNYTNWISDPVKGTYKNKSGEDLKQYFKVWFRQLLKHPETYVEAFLHSTASYYSISSDRAYFANYFYHDAADPLLYSYTFPGLGGIRGMIYNVTEKLQDIPIIRLLFQAGTYTWMSLILICIAILKKKYEAIVIAAPLLISILVCMASPVTNCVRYMVPVMASLPMCIGYVRWRCFGTGQEEPVK